MGLLTEMEQKEYGLGKESVNRRNIRIRWFCAASAQFRGGCGYLDIQQSQHEL